MNQTTNGELTPKAIKEAFSNLPFNYVVEVQKVLEKFRNEGKTDKTYSDRYIQKVKSREAFNETILLALFEVGTVAKEKKQLFGIGTKKTPSTN